MTTQARIVNTLLNDAMENIYDNYRWLQVSTSDTALSNTLTTLPDSVQIGLTSGEFNKVKETGALGSFIINNRAVWIFKLLSGEPDTLPVNLHAFGLMKQQTNGAGLGIHGRLPVAATKDNQSVWQIRNESQVRRA